MNLLPDILKAISFFSLRWLYIYLAEELKIVLPDKAKPPLYSKSADFLELLHF
jgi:hypothetical protein